MIVNIHFLKLQRECFIERIYHLDKKIFLELFLLRLIVVLYDCFSHHLLDVGEERHIEGVTSYLISRQNQNILPLALQRLRSEHQFKRHR